MKTQSSSPGMDQIILQRALVLQVLLGLAAVHLVERRLGDVESRARSRRHVPKKNVRSNVRMCAAIHIGVSHEDDLVVAQLVDGRNRRGPHAGAESRDERAELAPSRACLIETRALDIQDFAPQGQHSLEFAVASGHAWPLPPAESPSTITARTWPDRAPGNRRACRAGLRAVQPPLRRVNSRALRAASRAAAASTALPTIVLAEAGVPRDRGQSLVQNCSTTGRTSE